MPTVTSVYADKTTPSAQVYTALPHSFRMQAEVRNAWHDFELLK